ncbi:MAG TPA: hypothetical protein P5514_11355 [Bacteroidales bacterium]|nr:hypothetical protein [Bacteroidales bacterium]HRX97534.1 hypothetical protein [Bacteroidales bacterium]
MNLVDILKIVRSHIVSILLVPVLLGAVVTFLTADSPMNYTTKTKIYTGLASGYSIESQQNSSFNFFAINNAFDNLINLITARSTIEETGLRLYALHLIQEKPELPIMTMRSMQEVKQITPPDVMELVDKNSLEKTYQNLLEYKNKDEANFVYKLINLNHPHYSFKAISGIKARRIASSDMIEITFDSDDPAICYQTVNILVHTFIKSFASLKENQTDAVVKYFEKQLEIAHEKLQGAERKLLNFNQDNKIINYYEQTKHIASEKEKFELERQTVMLNYAAAESVITNLESNMGARVKLKLQGNNIVDLRKKLSEVNEKIALRKFNSESLDSTDTETTESLQLQAEILKSQMQQTIDSLHFYENTKEGLRVDDIINNWLQNVIAFEEAKAKLTALEIRRGELEETIKHFAPLGANLKKIEREIDVFEREYLSLLHSLGLAKLKQQDIELSSNIKIVDPPVLPISPQPSKRKFLIVAAVFAGFILTLGIVLLLHFFDTTLQNTFRTEKTTGLQSLGNYPRISDHSKKGAAQERMKDIATASIINNIFKFSCMSENDQYKIGIISNFKEEGKSLIAEAIKTRLDLSKGEKTDNSKNKTFIIIEYPSLIGNPLPKGLECHHDLLCIVVRADRGWEEADRRMLEIIQKVSNETPIGFILNYVKSDYMNDFIGPVPAQRSAIRRFVKRIALLRFFQKFELKQN